MAEAPGKVETKHEESAPSHSAALQPRHPFDALRREMDRLFADFDRDLWSTPFRRPPFAPAPLWRQDSAWAGRPAVDPAVDIVETAKAYEITAELPGLDDKDIEVKLDHDGVRIRGAKREETEEKTGSYHLQERRFGAFERYFAVPPGVDADRIEARFNKGILTLTLPKKPDAQKPEKTIEIKGA